MANSAGFVNDRLASSANLLKNVTTAPVATPGFGVMYAANGNLYYQGPTGPVTWIANGQYSGAEKGTAVLGTGGTTTVNTNCVQTNSLILLSCQLPGGTAGALRVNSRVNGSAFTIRSSNTADRSTVGWVIINQ